jgi:hypothetical protein
MQLHLYNQHVIFSLKLSLERYRTPSIIIIIIVIKHEIGQSA